MGVGSGRGGGADLSMAFSVRLTDNPAFCSTASERQCLRSERQWHRKRKAGPWRRKAVAPQAKGSAY